MKKVLCSIMPILAIALVIGMVSGVASAQIGETFTTNYYANNTTAGAPPATLRFTQHGSVVGAGQNECANIYVYAADQQLTECCGCPVSTNGLVHENVQKDLLGNTLTRVVPNEGVIQIVSGLPTGGGFNGNGCDPRAVNVSPEIDSWLTHIQNKVGTAFPITEDRGDEEYLSSTELGNLEADCAFTVSLGSGFGICSCNPEALK